MAGLSVGGFAAAGLLCSTGVGAIVVGAGICISAALGDHFFGDKLLQVQDQIENVPQIFISQAIMRNFDNFVYITIVDLPFLENGTDR